MTNYQCVGVAVFLIPEQEISIATLLSPFYDVFNLEIFSFIVLHRRNCLLNFFEECEYIALGSAISSHEDFRCRHILEI
jgi:hypothetical protein